jgi:hypothetical protein
VLRRWAADGDLRYRAGSSGLHASLPGCRQAPVEITRMLPTRGCLPHTSSERNPSGRRTMPSERS